MKKAIFSLIVVLISLNLSAQLTIYGKRSLNDQTITPCATIFGVKKIANSDFAFTYFALVSPAWAEIMIGGIYSLTDDFKIGLNTGFEQKPSLIRFGGSFVYLQTKNTFVLAWEKGIGQGNYWYKGTWTSDVSEKINIGLRAWRFHGFGPFIEYKIPALQSKVWIMPGHELEKRNGQYRSNLMLGVEISL